MAVATLSTATTHMTASSVSLDGGIPLTALSVAGASGVLIDNYQNSSKIKLPERCKWALFSGSADFLVMFKNDTVSGAFPSQITGLADYGMPYPKDPDNGQGIGSPGSILLEVSPGLRDVSQYTEIEIMGLGDGFVTVSYYE